MKFGVREICDVVFKATAAGQKVGGETFAKGQPVLYIETAKTSTLESAATTVYATGGRGNSRLLAWEGEKTLTFTVEDAMLSPMGLSVLSGAGLMKAGVGSEIYVHTTAEIVAGALGAVVLTAEDLGWATGDTDITIVSDTETKVFGTVLDENGEVVEFLGAATTSGVLLNGTTDVTITGWTVSQGDKILLDLYVEKASGGQEITIDAGNFAGYYYVEASTLFRDQGTGEDIPAEFIIPKAKIQSNFTFAMASTGDPSTFSFVMDAFPAPTRFSAGNVLCVIQVMADDTAG